MGCDCAWNAGNICDSDMHHGTCVTHMPRCMPESLASGLLWRICREKRSRHSRRLRSPQFCGSGKRLMTIRSSDNESTDFWPPGSLHTLVVDGHIEQSDQLFMWIKILCTDYILLGIPTIESSFDVANMVKTATVKYVPIYNDALLNIQACLIHVWGNGICSPIW